MTKKFIPAVCFCTALGLLPNFCVPIAFASPAQTAQQPATQTVRQLGTIVSISATSLKLKTDAGVEIEVSVPTGARVIRTVPGQKDLSTATVIALQDLQVGDRILVRGKSGDNGSVVAQAVIAMKSEDIAKKNETERMDWQRRGVGGLVRSVDPATGVITISTNGFGVSKTISIKTSKQTIVRRYAPDSVRFDAAKLATIAEIKPGDQLRARGAKNEDGTEVAAEEVVSGSFRNVAGTVIAVDAASNTVKVMDLATKKPLEVKITAESQMHKLPAMAAQMIAMRIKPGAHGAQSPAGSPANGAVAPSNPHPHANGQGDLQQALSNMPVTTLADLHKNDAVMIVATQGSDTLTPVAITLLSGVEPILTASPSGSGAAASILSPWNMSNGGGEGEAQ